MIPTRTTQGSAALAAALLFACGGTQGEDPTPTPELTPAPATATPEDPEPSTPALLTYYRDVLPITQKNCQGCHQAGSIAPYELTTYEQVKELAPVISAVVAARTMPPFSINNSGECNHYANATWLSDEEISTLVRWAQGPKEAGDPADAPAAEVPEMPSIRVDTTLDIGVDYTPSTTQQDDYRCFVVDPAQAEDTFVTGFAVRPGEPRVVHHVLVYNLYSADDDARVAELDAQDEGPGYACFGGPGANGTLLAVWAPGVSPTHFPEDTGLKLTAGRSIVIQLHYNTATAVAPDRTRIDLELDSSVRKEAQMILTGDWDMVLPGGRSDAWTFTEVSPVDLGAPIDVTVWAVAPHMHKLGRSMDIDVFDSDGGACTMRAPAYNFNWQQLYWLEQPMVVEADDVVRITCHYDTRERDQMVAWGEGTSDEMCLATFYLTFGKERDAVRPEDVGFPVEYSGGVEQDGEAPARAGQVVAGGAGADNPRRVVWAPDGGYYLGGYTASATFSLGEWEITLPGGGDSFIARFDPNGEPQWLQTLGGTGADYLYHLDVDPEGGVVAAGAYDSADLTVGDQTLPARGGADLWAVSLSADGALRWVRSWGSDRDDALYHVAVDQDGTTFLGGIFRGTLTVGEVSLTSLSDSYNGVLFSVGPDGVEGWARSCSSTHRCLYRAADAADGSLVVAGYFSETADWGAGPTASAGDYDGFVASLDPATGEVLWSHAYGNIYQDTLRSVALGPDGGVVVSGYFTGTLDFGQGGPDFMGSTDGFISSFDDQGAFRWSLPVGNVAGDNGTSVAVGEDGRVYLATQTEGPAQVGATLLRNAGKTDVTLAAASPDGQWLWSRRFGSIASDSYPLLDTSQGGLLLTWAAGGTIDVDGERLTNLGGMDAFVLRMAW